MSLRSLVPSSSIAKVALLGAVALVVSVVFSACGGGDSSTSGADTSSSAEVPEAPAARSDKAASELPKNTCQGGVGCNVYDKVPWESLEGKKVVNLALAALPSIQEYTKPLETCLEEHGASVQEIPSEFDLAKLRNNMQQAFNTGTDAIILMATPMEGFGGLLKEGAAKGIPVVGYGIGEAQPNLVNVSSNQYEDGYKAAEMLVEKVGDEAKIGFISGTVNSDQLERTEGIHDYLKEHAPKAELIENQLEDFSIGSSQQMALAMLQANPDIEGWIGIFGEPALGIAAALKSQGKEAPVVSMNGEPTEFEAIENGELYGTVADARRAPAELSCETLAVMLNGEKPFGEKALMPSPAITAANLPPEGRYPDELAPVKLEQIE